MLALALAACGGDDDGATETDAGGRVDSGSMDSGTQTDSGTQVDSGEDEEVDSGSEPDSGGGDDAGSDAGGDSDAGSDGGGGDVCAPPGIGAACDAETGECQTGLRCYTGSAGDFCSVDRAPDCGGFAHTRCPASAPYCLRPIGSSLGACATEQEAICICAVASEKIQPGEGTEGCPTPPR
ncbi:hypothetical protein [Sandaracinus amylolyticus]|uniref:Uncharacterized protein n=1 Tax=Sandaracinus amylolyticus TaxID=927083 RepID=A0A0F6SHP7_9BACT|nr:hypothetical protein [Sandaracinus amylolyticus]AKF10814.1 hypothetical protein DB32_007963 [Sandaracinus amylolyticus]